MAIPRETVQAYQREIDRLKEQVRVERLAKNQAYSFILQSGLYSQWVEFCRFGLYGENPHTECAEYLSKTSEQQKKGRI